MVVFCKKLLIGHHKTCLSDGSTRLLHSDRIVFFADMYCPFADCNGTTGNKYHFLTLIGNIAKLPHQNIQFCIIQSARLLMLQRRGTDLDNDSLFILDFFP